MSERVNYDDLNPGDLIQFDGEEQVFMWIGCNYIVAGVHEGLPAEYPADLMLPDPNGTLTRVQKGTETKALQAGLR